MQSWTQLMTALTVVGVLSGCGANFTELNGGPSRSSIATPKVFTIQCRDTFALSGHTNLYGHFSEGNQTEQKETWEAACSFEGKPLPWLVTGVLHAGLFRHDEWASYRAELVELGASLGCPAVAVRAFPPTIGDGDEAVGALCVDPGQPPRFQGAKTVPVVSNANLDLASN